MKISLEQIDELRKRANVSFEDAKEALEKFEGDMVEALVYLEKNGKIKSKQKYEEKCGFWDKFKALVKRGNKTRFIITRREKTILNLSATLSIIIGILAFHVTIVGLIVALVAGCRFRIVKESGDGMKVNDTLDKMHDNIDKYKRKLASDVLKDE